MPKLDDQISTLQQRLGQLKLRQQRLDARQHALDTTRERKAETRRRIIVGALILEKMQQGAVDRQQILAWLDQSVSRASDRTLFGLSSAMPIKEA